MTYRWVEHTAEVELAIEAADELDVYRDALAAFAELVGDSRGEEARHALALDAGSRADLLVAWLEELLYLADTAAFVPDRAEGLVVEGTSLEAVVVGRRGEPRPLVKAVTYHDLVFEEAHGDWHARVVFDV